jgi:hypothetical protein
VDAGGTEYHVILGYKVDATNPYRSAWVTSSKASPFVYTRIGTLSSYTGKTFRAMSVALFKGWFYQASQHQEGSYAPRASRYQPNGTIYAGAGTGSPSFNDIGWRFITRLGSAGAIKNGQYDVYSTSSNGLISIDYMFEYDNDGSGGNTSQLYLANGGSCIDTSSPNRCLQDMIRNPTTQADGGVVRTKVAYSTSANPPLYCNGTGTGANKCDEYFEDVTPTSDTWERYMSKALPQKANSGQDWDYLIPDNTIAPSIKAVPKMVNFNGDLYMIRNACSSITVQTLSASVHDTCAAGDERPQLWKLPANCGNAAACQASWTFIGDGTSYTTQMSGAEWLNGIDQAGKTANNKYITLLEVVGDRLYVGFDNGVDGLNVWRTKALISNPTTESNFEAVCETGHECFSPDKQFGLDGGDTKIFDSISVNDAGTDFLIFNARTGTSAVRVYRSTNF